MLKSVSIICKGKSTEAVIDEVKKLIEENGGKYYVKLFLWNDNLRLGSLEGHLEDLEKKLRDESHV